MAASSEDPNDNQGNYLQSSDYVEDLSKDAPFDVLLYKIKEGEDKERISAIKYLRQSLDRHHDDVLTSSVVSDLVDCMKPEEPIDLQFEAAWALTNIASGSAEETKCVVDGGAVPRFVQLIESQSDNVREQVIWALGNIVGDGPAFRDIVLDYGIVYSLSPIIGNVEETLSVRRQASWVFSNLCRHKHCQLSSDLFQDILPVFTEGLVKEEDSVCIKELCWGISYITDSCPDDRLTIILNTTILSTIVKLLRERKDDKDVIVPGVRVIGNISTSNDDHTQCIIENGGLPILSSLLSHEAINVRKEVTWTLSNITAGTQDQKQSVIDEDIVPKVLNIINGDAPVQLKKEAVWVISNIVDNCTVDQGSYVANQGGLTALGSFLEDDIDDAMKLVALEGIASILSIGDTKKDEDELETNPYLQLIAEFQYHIKALMDSDDRAVKGKAKSLWTTYCDPDNLYEEINRNNIILVKMAAVKEHMRRQGIILNSNWLMASIERIRQENRGVTHSAAKMNELVYTRWLHSDINDSCTPTLPHSILQQASGTLTGSYIVQVQSVINVGSSAYGQLMKIKGRETEEIEVTPHADNVKPTRMMYLSLTDGGVACNGMEYSPIRCINNKLPPGIKLCLNGPIRYRLGTLLLAEDNVNVLGGCVEELMRINTEEKILARTLNREDLITEEGGVGGASDTESVQLLSISQLTNNQLPPIVYVKATIMRLTGPLSPNEGVWSLEATIADGTGTIPVLLGNGPLEILTGFTANEYQQIPRTQGEEALRKCQDILSRLYCVMELTINSRNNKPTVTRLLDV